MKIVRRSLNMNFKLTNKTFFKSMKLNIFNAIAHYSSIVSRLVVVNFFIVAANVI